MWGYHERNNNLQRKAMNAVRATLPLSNEIIALLDANDGIVSILSKLFIVYRGHGGNTKCVQTRLLL